MKRASEKIIEALENKRPTELSENEKEALEQSKQAESFKKNERRGLLIALNDLEMQEKQIAHQEKELKYLRDRLEKLKGEEDKTSEILSVERNLITSEYNLSSAINNLKFMKEDFFYSFIKRKDNLDELRKETEEYFKMLEKQVDGRLK